ncbi:MAG: cation:proton antiporter [Lachnospiraceae bacterium]|nr:cation:proton antiporter [Lachnospiraceae bacterium]
MDTLDILWDLALIILFAKFFALVARKLNAPQVAGEIVAGILIGPTLLNLVQETDFLNQMAEVGVILLMFSAGLETDLNQLKKSGIKATLIACSGVLTPLVLGTLMYMCFFGFSAVGTEGFIKAVFIGTILTATSVSITVQVLKELGKISTELGMTIMSAAIIDDVIGILVLTAVIGMRDPKSNFALTAGKTGAFFLITVIAGVIVYNVMERIDERYPHTRRIPIISIGIAFILSYVADYYFGVADITGAFFAGVILSSLKDSDYIEWRVDINSYTFFGPVFFTSIGLQTNLRTLDTAILLFSVVFVIVGLLSKVIGCGFMGRILGYKGKDALKIGVGMMTRGEVALIVTQRGLKAGIIGSEYFTAVILLIVVSSLLTPLLLKALFSGEETGIA